MKANPGDRFFLVFSLLPLQHAHRRRKILHHLLGKKQGKRKEDIH